MRIRKTKKKSLTDAQAQARKLLNARKEVEALELLEELVERFPSDPELRLLYATILIAFRPDDVAKEAAQAAELGTNNPEVLVRAGHRLLFGGQIEAAESCANRARTLAPPDFPFMPNLLNLTGRIAALKRDDDLAEQELRSAVVCDPAHESYAQDLAVFLAERERLEDAIAVLDEALKHVEDKGEIELMRTRMTREADAQ